MPTLIAIAATASILIGTVTHIRDGDTIVLDDTPVRLQGIAAPELSEAGGRAAKAWMATMVSGAQIRCELTGKRSYDRAIGTCWLAGVDIGQAIVAAGLARDCKRFSGGRYARFETTASKRLPLPRYCEER